MKTFKEFLAESYEHLEEKTLKNKESEKEKKERRKKTKLGLLARMGAGSDKIQQEKRVSKLIRLGYRHLVRAGNTAKGSDVERAADRLGKGQTTAQKQSIQRRKKIINDLRSSYSEKDYQNANLKHNKLKAAGLDGHHITPLHYSRKLHASMSPEQWRERVSRDAKSGIYHGHHPKNLMGTVVANTPESRRRRGIFHKKGGAHELEAKTRDLYSTGISHKDVLTAAHRRRLKKQAEERTQVNNQN
jgi:hypothetical protein